MKKFIYSLFALVFLLFGCDNSSVQNPAHEEIAENKIYFFYYNECPYCHDAMEYINREYPNLKKISLVNIHTQSGYKMLFDYAKKYHLGNNVGTPLFAMGDKYIMGWSEENRKKFDEYVKAYLN